MIGPVSRANVFDAEFEYDDSDPPGYRSGVARVGELAGGDALSVKLYEVPPGESLCPYQPPGPSGPPVLVPPELRPRRARSALLCGFPPVRARVADP